MGQGVLGITRRRWSGLETRGTLLFMLQNGEARVPIAGTDGWQPCTRRAGNFCQMRAETSFQPRPLGKIMIMSKAGAVVWEEESSRVGGIGLCRQHPPRKVCSDFCQSLRVRRPASGPLTKHFAVTLRNVNLSSPPGSGHCSHPASGKPFTQHCEEAVPSP